MLDTGMVDPPGPAKAVALKFTLVRPLAGPCTMICVSTVSPRAPERVIDKTEPGASVCPTLTRLDTVHTGNGGKTSPDCVRTCTSGATKILTIANRISTTATNIRFLTCQKSPRASCPFRRLNLVRMPMALLSRRLVHGLVGRKRQRFQPSAIRTPKEKGAVEAPFLTKLACKRDIARPRSALAEICVGLSPARRLQAFEPGPDP